MFTALLVALMFFMSYLSNHADTNNIVSKVNLRLSLLRGIFKFSEQKNKTSTR